MTQKRAGKADYWGMKKDWMQVMDTSYERRGRLIGFSSSNSYGFFIFLLVVDKYIKIYSAGKV